MKIRLGLIFLFIVSIVISYLLATVNSPYDIIRGGDEVVIKLDRGIVIEQGLYFKNSSNIRMNFLAYDDLSDCSDLIHFFLKESNLSFDLPVSYLRRGWSLHKVKFPSNLPDGFSTLQISQDHIKGDNKCSVGVLLTSGAQKINLPYVKVNDGTERKSFLHLSYKIYSKSLFCIYLFAFFTVSFLTIFFKRTILNFLAKYWGFCLFLFVVIVNFIYCYPKFTTNNGWISAYWLPDFFKDGVLRKALVGSIYGFFHDYVDGKDLIWGYHILFLFLIVCLSCCFVYLLRFQSGSKNFISNLLICIYILSQGSVLYFISNNGYEYGRVDELLISLFAISIICFHNSKFSYCIFVLSSLAILTHQRYVFTLYPGVFFIFMCKLLLDKDKRYFIPFMLNICIPCLLTIYVQFFSQINMSLEKYLSIVDSRTNLNYIKLFFNLEYFMPTSENAYIFGSLDQVRFRCQLSLIFLFIPFIPFIVCLLNRFQSFNKSKLTIFFYSLLPIFSLFMFYTTSDYGRVWNELLIMMIVVFIVITSHYLVIPDNIFNCSYFAQFKDLLILLFIPVMYLIVLKCDLHNLFFVKLQFVYDLIDSISCSYLNFKSGGA